MALFQVEPSASSPSTPVRVCPWWLGWALVSPLRRWLSDPEPIVRPLAAPASRVLEVGPGYGFFTLPLLRAVGPKGMVHCVDLQPRMLDGLRRRLRRAGLLDRADLRLASATDLGTSDLAGSVDLAVLIYVLHEVPDAARLVRQVVATLGPEGRVLLLEPKDHCPPALFAQQVTLLREAGLRLLELPATFPSKGKQVALFGRP
jgi:ubiquinone/menaquinone biosynthesis C-methylase UbiE